MSDREFARLRSLPAPVFRVPPFWQGFQQRENTIIPSRSSETGGSQGEPAALLTSFQAFSLIYLENLLGVGDDDDDEPGQNDGSTRATSVESELGPAPSQDPLSREQTETHARLSSCTSESTSESIDRPTFPSAAITQQQCMQVVGEDDHEVAAAAQPPSASPPPLSQPSPASTLVPEEEEWEIKKIVGKRRAGKGYEYRVRWKDTWLPRSDLGNARRLLREFEAQRGPKSRKATRAGKAG